MNTTSFIGVAWLRRAGTRRGFTLVELLVVMGIITILAALLLPVIISAMASAELSTCTSNLRQVGQAYVAYAKDFDFWMASCGGNVRRFTNLTGKVYPFVEPPMVATAATALPEFFPFWYEALATYVNPSATPANAMRLYKKRNGKNYTDYLDIIYLIAEMCMLYQCPAKKQSTIGYGYNYAAPYGESIIYPVVSNPEDYPEDCDVAVQNWPSLSSGADNMARSRFIPKEFCWPYFFDAQGLAEPNVILASDYNPAPFYKKFPCFMNGDPAPVPILWWGQSVHASVITNPAAQIAICDTGLVINDHDATMDIYHPGQIKDPAEWNPADKWREAMTSYAGFNWTGYTRFPLNDVYRYGKAKKTYDALIYYYASMYQSASSVPEAAPELNLAWRPVPRHNGRTVSLFFDGNVRALNIRDITNFQWGDRQCQFDNRPQQKPPGPTAATPYVENATQFNPLPNRTSAGLPDVDATPPAVY